MEVWHLNVFLFKMDVNFFLYPFLEFFGSTNWHLITRLKKYSESGGRDILRQCLLRRVIDHLRV